MSLPKLGNRPVLVNSAPDWHTKDPKRFIAMLEKGMKRSVIHRVERKEVDDEEKTATFIVNSDLDDRDREIVLPSAVIGSKDIYLQNPVFLWGHRHRGNPEDILGTCLDAQLVDSGSKIEAKFRYDVEIHQQAATVFAQVKKGTVRAVSIGFIPRAWVSAWDPDEVINRLPVHAAEALKSRKVWVVYTEVEWIETSQVPIGSNRQALAASLGERNAEDTMLMRLYEAITGRAYESPEDTALEEELPEAETPIEEQEKEIETDDEQPTPEAEPESKDADLPGQSEDQAGAAQDETGRGSEDKGLEDRVKALEAELAEMKSVVKELLSAHVKSLAA